MGTSDIFCTSFLSIRRCQRFYDNNSLFKFIYSIYRRSLFVQNQDFKKKFFIIFIVGLI